jgi:hypothetical protein
MTGHLLFLELGTIPIFFSKKKISAFVTLDLFIEEALIRGLHRGADSSILQGSNDRP